MGWVRLHGLTLVLLICLSGSIVQAETENRPEKTQVYSLGEVVVSADQPGDKTIPILEITNTDMEKRNVKTLDKALELLPGVDVSIGGKGTPRINLRGYRARHTLLLLNGIPINSSYDGQFDPHLISTENISKIKLSYGSHSILYGQGGLAGVINIITRQGTQGLHGEVEGKMDDQGDHYTKANVFGGNGRVSFFATVNNSYSDGYSLSDDFKVTALEDGGIRENSDDRKLSFFGNLAFQPSDKFEIGATIERSTGEFGTPPSIVKDSFNSPKYDRTEDFETFSTQVSMGYHPGGVLGFRAWAFANTAKEDTARYDDNTYLTITKKNTYINSEETTIKGATVQTNVDLHSTGQVVISLSGEKDEYKSDLNKVLKNNNLPTLFQYDHDLNIYSAALEYKVQLFSTLDIIMGYGHHWQIKDEGKDIDKASYMVGASMDVSDSVTLWASFARKIRFPSIQQLYDGTAGDLTLKPEQSANYEAGISVTLLQDMKLDLSVFHNTVEEYIEKNAAKVYENNEEYEFKGFEARLAKQVFKNGNIGLGYAFLDSKDKSSGTQKDELQYRPKHKVTLDANYTFDFGLTAHLDYQHVAKQYYYSDTYAKETLNDYSMVNLRLEQNVYKKTVSIYLGVDNLLDENYEESYALPRAGRTGYAGIRVWF